MVGDGQKVFDHTTDGAEHSLGGCHRDILNTEHPVQARITYSHGELEVALRVGEDHWETCLRAENVKLPKRGYIGFTAATGGLAAKHELFAVTCATLEHENDPRVFSKRDFLRHQSLAPKVLLLLFILSGIGGLGLMYARQSTKRHQF